MNKDNKKIVAIVGRPNVGKSTLFNRIIGSRKAIESQISGTTRDRIFGEFAWQGHEYYIIDLAGIETKVKSEIDREVQESVDIAIENADLVLFVVDWTQGIDEKDKLVARKLKSKNKETILAINKSDNIERIKDIDQYQRLGIEKIVPVSAISGKNTGDLLDEIAKSLPSELQEKPQIEEKIRISILGRPNVGKSTLINSLLGQKRVVVSEVPGTTRDSIYIDFNYKNQPMEIIDTAGIRRRGKIEKDTIESFSVLRTYKALRESDITILIIDSIEGLVANDTHILGLAKDLGKGIILAVNKIDLKEDQAEYMARELYTLQKELNFTPWLPVVFISAKDKQNISALLNQTIAVSKNRKTEISEEDLMEILSDAKQINPQLENTLKLYQEKTNPPVFKLKYKGKEPHYTTVRYLENKIRDVFPMEGAPIFIDLIFAGKKRK